MVGDIDAAMDRADAELEAIGLCARGTGIAVGTGGRHRLQSDPKLSDATVRFQASHCCLLS
jgi:hypothetical protein